MMKKVREKIKDTCFKLVNLILNVNCQTLFYEIMNFVLQNDESKIYMMNTSKPGFV